MSSPRGEHASWTLNWRCVCSIRIYFPTKARHLTTLQGVKQVKRSDLKAKFVFVKPPSLEELEKRLRGRGTETEAAIQRRLEQALKDLEFAETSGVYDKIIVNDDLDRAYKELEEYLIAQLERNEHSQGYGGTDKTVSSRPCQVYRVLVTIHRVANHTIVMSRVVSPWHQMPRAQDSSASIRSSGTCISSSPAARMRNMAEVLPLQDDDQPKPTPQPLSIPKKKGVILGPDGKP
jgi:hypothetical protein